MNVLVETPPRVSLISFGGYDLALGVIVEANISHIVFPRASERLRIPDDVNVNGRWAREPTQPVCRSMLCPEATLGVLRHPGDH
jgi:hypothetical protein